MRSKIIKYNDFDNIYTYTISTDIHKINKLVVNLKLFIEWN